MTFISDVSKKQRESISERVKSLIPGDEKKDVVVLARRTRLVMAQLFYDKKLITLKQARAQLNGNLSPDKPETYYNDSGLLQLKEKDNGKNGDQDKER